MRRLVVVGASLAGLRAAQAARSAGYDGGLVVIGDEPHLPYTRPPLSKEMLHSGHTGEQSAFPIGELDVDWRLGTGAVALDRARRQLTLADGEHVTYERLIIATGCRARQWEGPGSGLPGVMTLRTLDDALALQTRLRDAGHILIVGAGFIGCEVAASARSLGVDVTLIDIAPHPMLPLGPELGERWFQMHSGHGVDLRMSVGVDSLEGNGRVEHARLTDGTRIDTDLVLIALGSRLNSEWLSGSGLEMNPGIVTDATLTSVSDPNVLAAGDIAASPVALADGAPTRIEHWTTAAEHGQLAGRNALLDHAERTPHLNPPYFWTDQYDVKIQSIGYGGGADRTELIESDAEGERYVAARLRGDRVVSAIVVNAPRRMLFYRKQIASGPALAELRELVSADPKSLGVPAAGASL